MTGVRGFLVLQDWVVWNRNRRRAACTPVASSPDQHLRARFTGPLGGPVKRASGVIQLATLETCPEAKEQAPGSSASRPISKSVWLLQAGSTELGHDLSS